MILVLLGTQNNSFHRLLEEIQRNIDNGNIQEEVIVQKGYTKFESKDMKLYSQLPLEKLKELTSEANFIITHAGVGSIITSIEKGKKCIFLEIIFLKAEVCCFDRRRFPSPFQNRLLRKG